MIQPRRTFRQSSQPAPPMLYPPGTTLADVPPLARGLTEMEYMDHCLKSCSREFPRVEAPPVPARKRR